MSNLSIYQELDRAFDSFINESGLNFIDIASEEYRTYDYPDGTSVTIYNPILLNVSPRGGHRVYDIDGISHYVVPGFVHIYWHAREGAPNFIA